MENRQTIHIRKVDNQEISFRPSSVQIGAKFVELGFVKKSGQKGGGTGVFFSGYIARPFIF